MPLFIAENKKAETLLNDENFVRKWSSLAENCAWGTIFQTPVFVKTWFEIYGDVFDLLFVFEENEAKELTALFPLAIEKQTGKICAAGDYHAEYQAWLATEANANGFAEKSLDALAKRFPEKKLELLFLAPNAPLEWTKNKNGWGGQINLLSHSHPIIEIGGGEKSEESLRKRGNKTRLRQLNKIGAVRLEKLETAEELEAIFDEIEDYSKIRLSALHNVAPVCDRRRKRFHAALMRVPNLIDASVLRVGERIASAKVSLKNRGEMLLSITSMSPFLARQSPSKLHILMLGKEYAKRKIPVFDLSPGGGYKERFATACKTAHSVTIFFSRKDFLRHKSKRKIYRLSKESLERLSVTKTRAYAFADKLLHKLKRVKYRTIPRTILKNTRRKIYELKECRIYSFDARHVSSRQTDEFLKRDSISDLLKYSPVEGWQFTASEFHLNCLERFENGYHSFTVADDETLLHYGWLIERQETSRVFEVEQEFDLPPNSAVLFDFYTHPKARRRGLYRKSLLQGLFCAARVPETEQVFIGVMADNAASRRVIENAGFVYRGSLFKETRFGKVRKWQIWEENSEKKSSADLTENFGEAHVKAEKSELQTASY